MSFLVTEAGKELSAAESVLALAEPRDYHRHLRSESRISQLPPFMGRLVPAQTDGFFLALKRFEDDLLGGDTRAGVSPP